jgi:hypothetical protein
MPNYKYGHINHVWSNATPYVRNIIESCPLRRTKKHIVVDVKTHYLKIGQIPALPHWHLDGYANPYTEEYDDINHLFVSGQFCLTDFLASPLEVHDYEMGISPTVLLVDCPVVSIPGNTIVTYDRHIHRATPAKQEGHRLLVRVTETNRIKPNNKIFKPTYTGAGYERRRTK